MLNIAILGTGYMGELYMKMLAGSNFNIVGVSGRTREKGIQFASKYKVRFFDDYEKMIMTSDIDILIIAIPTTCHLDAILTAARNNIKYIFCEKPVGSSLSEAKKIEYVCSKNKIKLGIGYKMRFEAIFSQTKSMINDGYIGDLAAITFNYFQSNPPKTWYLDAGVIRETLSHVIDLSNWFAKNNKAESVYCSARTFLGGKSEDRASLIINYSSGLLSNITGAWIGDYPFIAGRRNIIFQVIGKKGYISGIRPDTLISCDAKGPQYIKLEIIDPVNYEFQDFMMNLKNGDPSITITDAINVHLVIDAAVKSIACSKAIKIQSKS